MDTLWLYFILSVTILKSVAQPDLYHVCEGKGSLTDRIENFIRKNDLNSDGVISGPEIFDVYTNDYDTNQDGCVDRQEWDARFQNGYMFSKALSDKVWPGDNLLPCPLTINNYRTDPMRLQNSETIDAILDAVIEVCGNDPTLKTTNCDCLQLRSTCTLDANLWHFPACLAFTGCSNSTLVGRFQANLEKNDIDGDGVITAKEIADDLRNNYDVDKNNCVTAAEWTNRWTSFYTFSPDYARGRLADFVGNITGPCPIDITFYDNNDQVKIPVSQFLSANVQSLIDICKADLKLMTTNCDCSQLPDMCKNGGDFKILSPCIRYTASATGCPNSTLADRFQANLMRNDIDGDGVITAKEIADDLHNNYDVDKNNCVTAAEWTNRWTSFYKFSPDYAQGRLADFVGNITGSCPINITFYDNNDQVKIPVNQFLSANVQSLIKICQNDSNFMTANCDCSQLPNMCNNDITYKTLPSCILYRAKHEN